ncbi:MAG TPA: hypothetical protein VF527_18540 [Pyrinomonadaceae bacterium]|jgi:hypothetical protein
MRKDNSTRTPHARARREPSFDEPIRRWSTLPISEERARELVNLITRREDSESREALIELREPGSLDRVDLRADAAHAVGR